MGAAFRFCHELVEARRFPRSASAKGAFLEQAIVGDDPPLRVDESSHDPCPAEQVASLTAQAICSKGDRIGRSCPHETPEEEVALGPHSLDFDRNGTCRRLDTRNAARAVA